MQINKTPSQATHQVLDTSQGCKKRALVTYPIWRLQPPLTEKWKIKSTILWPSSFWIRITSRIQASQVNPTSRGGSKSAAKVMLPPKSLHPMLVKLLQYMQGPLCPTPGLSFQKGRSRTTTSLSVEYPLTMTHIKKSADWLRKVSQALLISQGHLSWPKDPFQEHNNGAIPLRAHMPLRMWKLSKTLTETRVKRMMKQRKLTQSHHF